MSVPIVADCEVGDFILAAPIDLTRGGPILGVVVRPMTPEEILVLLPGGGEEGIWVITGTSAHVPIYSGQFGYQILSLVKSHKIASDDLGPAVGLAE